MRPVLILGIFLCAVIAVALGGEEDTLQELIDNGIIDEDAEDTKRGGYYRKSSYESKSKSSHSKFNCEKKINKAMFRIHKCESAASKIQSELQDASKKIEYAEKELNSCKTKKTCDQITDELLTTFNGAVRDAYRCVESSFDRASQSSGSKSNSGYSDHSY